MSTGDNGDTSDQKPEVPGGDPVHINLKVKSQVIKCLWHVTLCACQDLGQKELESYCLTIRKGATRKAVGGGGTGCGC